MRFHGDYRADRFCDIVPALPGDLNVFILSPGQVSAWHRHKRQTDTFFAEGDVVFGTFTEGDGVRYRRVLREPFVVAPGVWHGYKNVGSRPAVLVMYLDQKYDQTDEERVAPSHYGKWPT